MAAQPELPPSPVVMPQAPGFPPIETAGPSAFLPPDMGRRVVDVLRAMRVLPSQQEWDWAKWAAEQAGERIGEAFRRPREEREQAPGGGSWYTPGMSPEIARRAYMEQARKGPLRAIAEQGGRLGNLATGLAQGAGALFQGLQEPAQALETGIGAGAMLMRDYGVTPQKYGPLAERAYSLAYQQARRGGDVMGQAMQEVRAGRPAREVAAERENVWAETIGQALADPLNLLDFAGAARKAQKAQAASLVARTARTMPREVDDLLRFLDDTADAGVSAAQKAGHPAPAGFWRQVKDAAAKPFDLVPAAKADRDMQQVWVVMSGPLSEARTGDEALALMKQWAENPEALVGKYGQIATSPAGKKAQVIFQHLLDQAANLNSVKAPEFNPAYFAMELDDLAMGALRQAYGYKKPNAYMRFANAWRGFMSEFYLTAWNPRYIAGNTLSDLTNAAVDGYVTFEHAKDIDRYLNRLGDVLEKRITTGGKGAREMFTGLPEGKSRLPGVMGKVSQKGQEIVRYAEPLGRVPLGEEPRARRVFYVALKRFIEENALRLTPPPPPEVTALYGPRADDLLHAVSRGMNPKEKREAVLQFLNATTPGQALEPTRYLDAVTADAMSPEIARRVRNELGRLPAGATEDDVRAVFDRIRQTVDDEEAAKLAKTEIPPVRKVASDTEAQEIALSVADELDEAARRSGDPELAREAEAFKAKAQEIEAEVIQARAEAMDAAKAAGSRDALDVMMLANRECDRIRDEMRLALDTLMHQTRRAYAQDPSQGRILWPPYFQQVQRGWEEAAHARIARYQDAAEQLRRLGAGEEFTAVVGRSSQELAEARLLAASEVPEEAIAPKGYAPGSVLESVLPEERLKFAQLLKAQRSGPDVAQVRAWREAFGVDPENYSHALDVLDSAGRDVEVYAKQAADKVAKARAKAMAEADKIRRAGGKQWGARVKRVWEDFYGTRNDTWKQFFKRSKARWQTAQEDLVLGKWPAGPTPTAPMAPAIAAEYRFRSGVATPPAADTEAVLAAAQKGADQWTSEEAQAVGDWLGIKPKPEQAPLPTQAQVTRQDWENVLRTAYQDEEKVKAALTLLDARAKMWARATGRNPADYYGYFFSDVGTQPFAEFAQQAAEGAPLFQRSPYEGTPEFKALFGDTAIVDETGRPMPVYHGTRQTFDEFKRGDIGFHFGTAEQANNRLKQTFVLQPDTPIGVSEGDRIGAYYLSIKNPLYMDDAGHWTTGDIAKTLSAKPGRPPGIKELAHRLQVEADLLDFKYAGEEAKTLSAGAPPIAHKEYVGRRLADDWATARRVLEEAGYDGIIYDNVVEGPGKSFIAFRPEQVKSVANVGTFSTQSPSVLYQNLAQRFGPDIAKGATQFDEDWRAVVRFFESADISTAPHEVAHVFLEDLARTATETNVVQVVEDLKTAERQLGLNEGEFLDLSHKARGGTATPDELKRYTRAHEEFARGFERYLAEGEAPTPELASVFERFKDWLLEIYTRIVGSQIDVQVSAEMRGVFNRLLADEAEAVRAWPEAERALRTEMFRGRTRFDAEEAVRFAGYAQEEAARLARPAAPLTVDDAARELLGMEPEDMDGLAWGLLAEKLHEEGRAAEAMSDPAYLDSAASRAAHKGEAGYVEVGGYTKEVRHTRSMTATKQAEYRRSLVPVEYRGNERKFYEHQKDLAQWYYQMSDDALMRAAGEVLPDRTPPKSLLPKGQVLYQRFQRLQVKRPWHLQEGSPAARAAYNAQVAMPGFGEPPTSAAAVQSGTEATLRGLDQMRDGVLKDWGAWAPQRADAATRAAVEDWLDNQVMPRWWETRATALQYAKSQMDFTNLDYTRRRGFDAALSYVMPYSYWGTRNAANWGKRFAMKPGLLSWVIRVKRAMKQANENAGRRQRFGDKVPVPFPWLPDWMGDTLYVDPMSAFLPLSQLADQRWDDADEARSGLQKVFDFGQRLGFTPYQFISWPFQAGAFAKVGERLGMDPEQARSSLGPRIPGDIPYALPYTRMVKAGTAALGVGGPGGVNIEAPLRRAVGLPGGETWDLYRVSRMLANIAAERGPRDVGLARSILIAQELVKRDTKQVGAWQPDSPIAQEVARELRLSPSEIGAAQELLAEAMQKAAQEQGVGTALGMVGLQGAVEPRGERAQLELAARARGTAYSPESPQGSYADYTQFKRDNLALYPRSTQYQVIPGETNEGMGPGDRANWLVVKEAQERINAEYDRKVDALLRERPYDTKGRGALENERRAALDAVKAKYPYEVSGGEMPVSLYGMNPQEEADSRVERGLQRIGETEPKPETFAGKDGAVDWTAYYDALDRWQAGLPATLPELQQARTGTYAGMDTATALRTYNQRFDSPLEAAAKVYRDTVSSPAWDKYHALVDGGTRKGAAWDQTVGTVGPMDAAALIPAILKTYQAKGWTQQQLQRELAGVTFPALSEQGEKKEAGAGGAASKYSAKDLQAFDEAEQLNAEIDRRWGAGVRDVEAGYFDLYTKAEKSAYLKAHPELRELWDYRDAFKRDHPAYAEYAAKKAADKGGRYEVTPHYQELAERVKREGWRAVYGPAWFEKYLAKRGGGRRSYTPSSGYRTSSYRRWSPYGGSYGTGSGERWRERQRIYGGPWRF